MFFIIMNNFIIFISVKQYLQLKLTLIGSIAPISNAITEGGFSTMNYILNEYRSCISNYYFFYYLYSYFLKNDKMTNIKLNK